MRLRMRVGSPTVGADADTARARLKPHVQLRPRHAPHGRRSRADRVHGRSSSTSGRVGVQVRSRPGAIDRARPTRDRSRSRCSCRCIREPEAVFRRALASVRAEQPHELIAIVDGGDADLAAVAARLLRSRAARAQGGQARGDRGRPRGGGPVDGRGRRARLRHRLGARARCARCCGRSPTRVWAGSRRGRRSSTSATHPVRRLADWIEDLRYLLTVPAQSVFGQVGCLAGRTIAYRRVAFEPAVEALVRQTVCGMPAARRRRPRADQRAAAHGLADRLPVDRARRDRRAARTGARSGASSCAGADRASARRCSAWRWLWRRPVAFTMFVDRHRHAVRALRDRGARRRARPRARQRAVRGCRSPLELVARLRRDDRRASACGRSRTCAAARATCCGCRCSCCSSRS